MSHEPPQKWAPFSRVAFSLSIILPAGSRQIPRNFPLQLRLLRKLPHLRFRGSEVGFGSSASGGGGDHMNPESLVVEYGASLAGFGEGGEPDPSPEGGEGFFFYSFVLSGVRGPAAESCDDHTSVSPSSASGFRGSEKFHKETSVRVIQKPPSGFRTA